MSQITTTIAQGVARISLARPPVNALDLDLLRTFNAALRAAGNDPDVACVLIGSDVPGRFCAGLDLPWLLDQDVGTVRAVLQELYTGLYDVQHNLEKPSIAMVGGTARGGGMTIAISCDVVLASESATFGYPEINLGLPPAIHFAHLPRIIGRHRAFELLFSGRAFGPAEARELGLVSQVVADAELEGTARALADTFAAKPAGSVRLARAAFMRQNDLDYRRSIAVAVEDFCNAFVTPAAQQALRRFVADLGKG